MILGRFLQGLGAGASATLAAAMMRDLFEGSMLAKYLSYLAITNVTLIAMAPLLGGYLQHYFGWRSSFGFLSVYTALALICVFVLLPETNKTQDKSYFRINAIKNNLITLFMHRQFLIAVFSLFLTYAGILSWLTSGPLLLQLKVGLTPVGFGWAALLIGVCYIIAGFINAKIVARVGMEPLLKLGMYCLLCAAILMCLFASFHILNVYVVVGPVMLFLFGSGFVFPNAYAMGMTPFAKIAGIAVAVLGCLQVLGGFISSTIVSWIPDESQWPIAITFLIIGILGLWLQSFLKKKELKNGV